MRSNYIDDTVLNALKKRTTGRTARPWLPFELADKTGLRIGDVLKARVEDLDGARLRYVAQKTGKAGVATLTPTLARHLQEAARNARGGWLFPSPYGNGEKHLTRQAAWARLKVAAKRAGVALDGISPHSMRKVYAVNLYKKQGLKAVQKALQHSTRDQTERYALSDWFSSANADEPLRRRDLDLICRKVIEILKAHEKESGL